MSKIESTFHPTNLTCIMVLLIFSFVGIGLIFFSPLEIITAMKLCGSVVFSSQKKKNLEKRHC